TITQERNMDYIIFYTTTNGETISPYDFDYLTNTYEDGVGMLAFDGSKVTLIGDRAFYDCDSLTSVTIPDGVTSIGKYAFCGCDSLTSVTIGVTSIGHSAFRGCDSLTSVTIGNGVTTIGENAFYDCDSLKSITIGNGVTKIGDSAFYYCDSLTSVYISDLSAWCKINFGSINANPLCYATKILLNGTEITELTIPSDVATIKNYAFIGCTSLTSITIPDSVTSIGDYAFRSCTSLKDVYCKPATPPAGDYCMFDDNASGRKIYVPRDSVEAYKSASDWGEYAEDIEGYDFNK
ncbi:MAG: leucine-rich repeat domain-containing protein, partial [Alistipes sp.]|nr:leucine-rich repeat domain-containing protein [Alistipes sp.]